jgi:KilA-N domain
LKVANLDISLISLDNNDFISLTDIAKYRNADEPYAVINNWIRNRSTLEFIGLWERINNASFKPLEFERFKNESGNNYFVLSPQKWIETTKAVGIISKSGRYGGTLAHIDIAFEFATWISSEFKLFLITEFKRLKSLESKELKLEWNLQRTISKINYRIQTDAIKENLIPKEVTKFQQGFIYALEADLLNVALFGKTAKEWKDENPSAKGNMRDDASIEQLVVLSNMESINALLINKSIEQKERLLELNKVAITQMKSLLQNNSIKKLK